MDEIMTPGITRKPGIHVTDIVTAVQLGCSRDEIAKDLDLSLEQVNAALHD